MHTLKDAEASNYADTTALQAGIDGDSWTDKWDVWTYTAPTVAGSICVKNGAGDASYKLTTGVWAAAAANNAGNTTASNSTANASAGNGTDNETSGAKTMGAAFAAAALAVAATQF